MVPSNPVFFPDVAFSKMGTNSHSCSCNYITRKNQHKICKVVAISSVMAKYTRAMFLYNIGFNNSWLLVCCSNGFLSSVSLQCYWIPRTSGIEGDSSSVDARSYIERAASSMSTCYRSSLVKHLEGYSVRVLTGGRQLNTTPH